MEQVTKTVEAFSKAARDAAEFGRGNLEAVAQSAQAYIQGTQELGRQALAFTRDLNAQAVEGVKALAGAKSFGEVAEIQARFTRTALERAAGEGPRLQRAAFEVAERAFAPLTRRAAAAAGQASRPLAA